ncbi:MAG: hypothetical protein IPM98_10020 [Lewinellaceae bacterium]|nr:hypothetical protein [Lewinellaceae bacterium]
MALTEIDFFRQDLQDLQDKWGDSVAENPVNLFILSKMIACQRRNTVRTYETASARFEKISGTVG